MRVNALTPAVIFALNLGSAEQDKELLHLHGLHNAKEGIGCFEGVEERCWFVAGPENFDAVRAVCKETSQDAVLFLDNQYNAYLGTSDAGYPTWNDGAQYIGEFKEVPAIVAQKQPGYSRFGDRWFTAVK